MRHATTPCTSVASRFTRIAGGRITPPRWHAVSPASAAVSCRPRELQHGSGDRIPAQAAEVATLLGVPKSWVYEESREGRIPTVALGRYRRYRREAIEPWIAQIEAPARGARAYGVRRAA
jgi:excisionase family DNA binding protein